MFDWFLFMQPGSLVLLGYLISAPVWFLAGIGFWMRHIEKQEAAQLAADIEARMSERERETDHDAVAWKLLEECDFL